MSFTHFPDGIKIGPDATGDDRLVLTQFDEYATSNSVSIGEMAGGEVKTLVIPDVLNATMGETVIARPMNPGLAEKNYNKLLIMHAWVSSAGEVSVIVRNLHSSTVDFESDQWNITHFSTL